jgi:hypothetical protein
VRFLGLRNEAEVERAFAIWTEGSSWDGTTWKEKYEVEIGIGNEWEVWMVDATRAGSPG